jgi:hypothetical protein
MRPVLLVFCLPAALGGCGGPARVEVDPPAVQLFARGQSARVRAVALAENGKALPGRHCAWDSGDGRVATAVSQGNELMVTAAGPGSTAFRCRVGAVAVEVPVSVRVLSRLEVAPAAPELRLGDEPRPFPLEVRAFDQDGRPATPRRLAARCLDEGVCRGDDRGQLWPVGPGACDAEVEADGLRQRFRVAVVEARSASGRPRAVKGDPAEPYRRAAEALEREAARKAGR